MEIEKAIANYVKKLGTGLRPDLLPSRDLQKTLTQPLHALTKDWLWRSADELTTQRLNSLITPHATAWLSCRELLKILSQGEFVGGLTWVSGLKIRDEPYICPDCGREADVFGVHAVTCQRSGSISRGHSVLRNAIAELFAKAGISAAPKQRLPNSLDRPADLLVSSWGGSTVAVDFTIITPTRASASPSSISATTLMEQAANQK